MNHLLIAWLLLTPILLCVGTVVMRAEESEREDGDLLISSLAALIVFVLPFWAAYFLIV